MHAYSKTQFVVFFYTKVFRDLFMPTKASLESAVCVCGLELKQFWV